MYDDEKSREGLLSAYSSEVCGHCATASSVNVCIYFSRLYFPCQWSRQSD